MKIISIHQRQNFLKFGNLFRIDFERTVRIPDDGRIYNLPAGFGNFPLYKVADYIETVPFKWIKDGGGVFIPMYQNEAMWINFNYSYWHPHALRIGAGGVNVVNGQVFSIELNRDQDDYLVSPPQLWLDGFNAGDGMVRQFVAAPLGYGLTAEAIITGDEAKGGIQIVVIPPKKGIFPENDPTPPMLFQSELYQEVSTEPVVEMGLAGGGKIKQKIYPDEYGFDTWDQNRASLIEVHIVNSLTFKRITGLNPPVTPINHQTYKELGIPWFKIYDDEKDFINSEDFLE